MSLAKKQKALQTAQASLKEVVDKVQGLQSQYDESISTKERLAKESATLEKKLERADQLVNGRFRVMCWLMMRWKRMPGLM
eukprot:110182-Rhodomonas_salina.2